MNDLLKPVFPAQAGIHGVEVHGKTMDSRLRGNDELLHLGLSKRHSSPTLLPFFYPSVYVAFLRKKRS